MALRSQTLGYSTDDPSLTKPKRNKNPWVFYFMEHIPQAQAENPGTSSPSESSRNINFADVSCSISFSVQICNHIGVSLFLLFFRIVPDALSEMAKS